MAIFSPGPMIAEARGSVGGTVFSRNTHGAYTRNRTVPVNPQTVRQTQMRIFLETLQQRWRETLSQAQRDAWESYARGTPGLNKLGFGTILSGINVYIRTNSLLLLAGGSINDTAPATNGVAALPLTTFDSVAATGIRVVTIDPAPALGDATMFWISSPKAKTVNFFNGPWFYTNYAFGPILLPYTVLGPAFTTAGQRFFVRQRTVFADGRASAPFHTTIDIV